MTDNLAQLPAQDGQNWRIRNTFVEAVDVNATAPSTLRRSASDSDLSRSSGESPLFWLPSLSSKSSKASIGTRMGAPKESSSTGESSGHSFLMQKHLMSQYLCKESDQPEEQEQKQQQPQQSQPTTELTVGFPEDVPQKSSAQRRPDADVRVAHEAFSMPTICTIEDVASNVQEAVEQPSMPELVMAVFHETAVPVEELLQWYADGILQKIPRYATGEISSLGSFKHASQKCLPCLFWNRKTCSRGLRCEYCHILHEKKRSRPSKKTRVHLRAKAGGKDSGVENVSTADATQSEDGGESEASQELCREKRQDSIRSNSKVDWAALGAAAPEEPAPRAVSKFSHIPSWTQRVSL
mmetsp:Transcript_17183/g.46543  ORF Transcript_17183/g.46543 Transcript_17183/m.46543 type:complete len:353 (-) Transcript_17183:311-1369(-)|eukprot:CAMPEP_0194488226 /NCGR_PEP_ID=MMETSP0253-20130528/8222_1 /TAXON_ID=2966 /ORGANISM="Noctiluca scintillans" /LENGTH=352 /DNA_ID=CAMNT_0039328557 /DNA_START=25 /DNA_END=1083 /DNA_ORIENTATION=-